MIKVISPVNIEARQKLDIRAGDTVKVSQKIKEGEKTRIQMFDGIVLARKHGKEAGATFTVRKVASGVGVEKIFPLYSPMIDKIEIVKRSKVRRAKLYHIREKAAKEIKKEMRNIRALPDIKDTAVTEAETKKTEDAAKQAEEKAKEVVAPVDAK